MPITAGTTWMTGGEDGFWPWRCCGVGTRLPSSYSSKSDGTEYLWRRRIIVLVHTLATIGLLSLDRFKREQGGAGAQVGPTIRPVASWGEATFGTRWLSFFVRMDNDGSRMILDISRRNCQRPRFKFQKHTHTHTQRAIRLIVPISVSTTAICFFDAECRILLLFPHRLEVLTSRAFAPPAIVPLAFRNIGTDQASPFS